MDARNVARGYGQDRSHNFDLFHHAPGVWLGDIQPGRALARQCNEYMAQLGKDHPGRFGFFAALPLPDTDGSLKEIAYTLDVLKADGIGLMTNYNDKWSGKAAFAPVFEELNRRKAVVYFHPSSATCCTNLMPNVRQQIIEYPHDSIRAVLSMLLAGTFVKYRDIRFIFSHGGGTIPFLAGRIKQMTAQQKDLPQVAPQGVEYELKRLYYEIANASSALPMAALMKLVPLEQIMFGSDYPYVPIEVTADGLQSLALPPAKAGAIGRDNALKLLPKWK
jgi:6-methylsalicylate decarboxylase